jgi:hypothetical protein
MTTQEPMEVQTRNLFVGRTATGKYDITLNGEKFNATKAGTFIGCLPPFGCLQEVSFTIPEEVLTIKHVIASVPLHLPPGTYPVTNDATGATASYSISRKTTDGGWYTTRYRAGEGYFTFSAAVEQTQHMKGHFEFVVMIEGLRQTLAGTFDIQEAAMP